MVHARPPLRWRQSAEGGGPSRPVDTLPFSKKAAWPFGTWQKKRLLPSDHRNSQGVVVIRLFRSCSRLVTRRMTLPMVGNLPPRLSEGAHLSRSHRDYPHPSSLRRTSTYASFPGISLPSLRSAQSPPLWGGSPVSSRSRERDGRFPSTSGHSVSRQPPPFRAAARAHYGLGWCFSCTCLSFSLLTWV